jgi:hypothetical protein
VSQITMAVWTLLRPAKRMRAAPRRPHAR